MLNNHLPCEHKSSDQVWACKFAGTLTSCFGSPNLEEISLHLVALGKNRNCSPWDLTKSTKSGSENENIIIIIIIIIISIIIIILLILIFITILILMMMMMMMMMMKMKMKMKMKMMMMTMMMMMLYAFHTTHNPWTVPPPGPESHVAGEAHFPPQS